MKSPKSAPSFGKAMGFAMDVEDDDDDMPSEDEDEQAVFDEGIAALGTDEETFLALLRIGQKKLKGK